MRMSERKGRIRIEGKEGNGKGTERMDGKGWEGKGISTIIPDVNPES